MITDAGERRSRDAQEAIDRARKERKRRIMMTRDDPVCCPHCEAEMNLETVDATDYSGNDGEKEVWICPKCEDEYDDHLLCINCNALIPGKRLGSYGTCSKACSDHYYGER